MRKRILLAFWILGILFPMAWIGRFSPRFLEIFDSIFSPEWMHWLMHAALYAGLVVLIMFAIDLRPSIKALIWVILISVGVGIVQEGLQLLSGAQLLRWNSLIDLGVDTGGALFGYIMVIRIRKLREIKVSSQS